MTTYLDKLRQSARATGSIACMGLDPVVEAMPKELAKKGIWGFSDFLEGILDEMEKQKVSPGAFKPNQGFYLQHDKHQNKSGSVYSGSTNLNIIMRRLRAYFPEVPIILDFKRGDIATSSANYAREGFDSWGADAVTISPYMGTDSVTPFIERAMKDERGVYILDRTSNPGAADFQNLRFVSPDVKIEDVVEKRLREFFEAPKAIPNEEMYSRWIMASDTDNFVRRGMRDAFRSAINDSTIPLYEAVASKIVEWAKGNPGVGAVVGATSLEELTRIAGIFVGRDIPLLIPGVGGQGGSARDVVSRLRDVGHDLELVRINSSSGLTHPWAKRKEPAPEDYAKVCVAELAKLNDEIGYKAA